MVLDIFKLFFFFFFCKMCYGSTFQFIRKIKTKISETKTRLPILKIFELFLNLGPNV